MRGSIRKRRINVTISISSLLEDSALKYDTICIEDLNVAAMKKLYGKKISDLAFSDFVRILKYEASKFDTLIVEVGRFFASSQLCSECGEKNPQVKDLKIREWICPKCGAHHDRDRNAAINILLEGLGQRPMQETKSDFAFIRSFGC